MNKNKSTRPAPDNTPFVSEVVWHWQQHSFKLPKRWAKTRDGAGCRRGWLVSGEAGAGDAVNHSAFLFSGTRNGKVDLCPDFVGQLSRYEIETLQDAARRHAEDDEWELSRLTHEFPEWKKNNPGTSSRPIPQADVLEAVGRADSLQDILEEAAEKNHMESLLGR